MLRSSKAKKQAGRFGRQLGLGSGAATAKIVPGLGDEDDKLIELGGFPYNSSFNSSHSSSVLPIAGDSHAQHFQDSNANEPLDVRKLRDAQSEYTQLRRQVCTLPEGLMKSSLSEAAENIEKNINHLTDVVRQREDREAQIRYQIEAEEAAKEEARVKALEATIRLHEMNDLQKAMRTMGNRQHLNREMKERLQAHKDRITAARAAGHTVWIEAYDPQCDALYYCHPDKKLSNGQIRWDAPEYYIMADEDAAMRSVICIQCMYRAKMARRVGQS